MNKKRWLFASIAVFVLFVLMDFLFNGVFLKNLYLATSYLWRSEKDIVSLAPYSWFAYFIHAFLFTYIYAKGYEVRPSDIVQGVKFGLVIGFFVSLPMAVTTYITMPLPIKLPFYWFVTGLAQYLVAGFVVGLIYRKEAAV